MGQELRAVLFISLCSTLFTACATVPAEPEEVVPAEVPEIRPGILQGYLAADAYPDSLALLPPPPSENSIAHVHDGAVSERSLTLRGSARWILAAADNGLMFPAAAETFSCAVGVPITEVDTPSLYLLLRRTLADAGLSTYRAKNHYQRQRPFMANGQPTCVPAAEQEHLAADGSYPSGHSSIGWAWALILAELAPDRADAILARGRAFGQSRVVCNVHWQSDVQEGQFMGSAAVAKLHSDPVFLTNLAAARTELNAVRARSLPPARDCEAEAAAMAQLPDDALWPMR